uniref:Tyrosine-protein phosphatase domain-containing protein n=1 Tax=Parastrongyloides trichosuri TaxID=131310 RepID=A0A0N4ZFR1_PARTI
MAPSKVTLKGQHGPRRKKTKDDDLITADECEKKPKKTGSKQTPSTNVTSLYTNISKSNQLHSNISKPIKNGGTSSEMKALSTASKQLPIKDDIKLKNPQSVLKPLKKKGLSKDCKAAAAASSKNVKKEFLKNEDEEIEGLEETKDNKDSKETNVELTCDLTKTCYISTDVEKDVRKKFCEQLLEIKTIKSVVANKEFKNPKYKPKNLPATAFYKNAHLNRYNDVICIDKTRVKLKRNLPGFKFKKTSKGSDGIPSPADSDYIHANYVKIPNSDFTYICCQGPQENTLEDHWLMCWQENVKVIVMLCETIEDNEEKCHKYWPDVMTKKAYGQIIVTNEKEDVNKYTNVVIRTLKLQVADMKRTLIQYHLRSWPDRLIPTGTPILCCLLREVQLVSGLNPIVVHCSAGIGRTGTFMGIHYISEKFKVSQDGSINVMEAIREMREQRLQSVQSTIQFGYLHICLLQYFCEENIYDYNDKVKEFIAKSVDLVHEYACRLAKKNKEKYGNTEK